MSTANDGYDAFISYRRVDLLVAKAIAALLRAFGQRVFLDVEVLRLGRLWEPELLAAAKGASSLLLLWSRSATRSHYIPKELSVAGPECRRIAILLDGTPLPPELGCYQALDGMKVHERLLARARDLVQSDGMSSAQALQTVVAELRTDGIELTPAQRLSLQDYVSSLRRIGAFAVIGSLLYWLWCHLARGSMRRAVTIVAPACSMFFVAGGYVRLPARLAGVIPPPAATTCAAIVDLEHGLQTEEARRERESSTWRRTIEQLTVKLDACQAHEQTLAARGTQRVDDLIARVEQLLNEARQNGAFRPRASSDAKPKPAFGELIRRSTPVAVPTMAPPVQAAGPNTPPPSGLLPR